MNAAPTFFVDPLQVLYVPDKDQGSGFRTQLGSSQTSFLELFMVHCFYSKATGSMQVKMLPRL